MSILMIGLLLHKAPGVKPRHAASGMALLLLMAAIGWPVMQGSFMSGRFSTTQRDLHVRTAHWRDALRMMDDAIATKLFGMGLGRYQQINVLRSAEGIRPATYRFNAEAGNHHLALGGSADALYFEQLVNAHPHQRYRVSVAARSQVDDAELMVALCEKWLLYSSHCIWQSIPIGRTNGEWQHFSVELDTRELPERPWYAARTKKLSFYNPVSGSMLDIDDVSILSADGKELLRNGDFASGMDHWFFVVDNFLPWHIENLWLQIYFEQGAVGVLLFVLLVAYTFIVLLARYREAELPMPVLAAALTGSLALGMVDSLFDAPRMALLFYLLVMWVIVCAQSRAVVLASTEAKPT